MLHAERQICIWDIQFCYYTCHTIHGTLINLPGKKFMKTDLCSSNRSYPSFLDDTLAKLPESTLAFNLPGSQPISVKNTVLDLNETMSPKYCVPLGWQSKIGLNSLCDNRISGLPKLTAWLPIWKTSGRVLRWVPCLCTQWSAKRHSYKWHSDNWALRQVTFLFLK